MTYNVFGGTLLYCTTAMHNSVCKESNAQLKTQLQLR